MQTRKQAERHARSLFRLCQINGSLDQVRVRQVVQQVIASGWHDGLGVLSRFQRLVRLETARHHAEVSSAAPLPDELRGGIEGALTRLYGPDVDTSFADDPALIGGVRIKVGSDVYDDSIKGRLAALESRFE